MAEHAHQLHGAAAYGRVLTQTDLELEFCGSPLTGHAGSRIVLDGAYAEALAQQVAIVAHQWREGIERGMVRGFCLTGPPGIGKTTLAKALGYELGVRFAAGAETDRSDSVVTVLLDGGDIARSKYGESEQRLKDVFRYARLGFDAPGQRAVLIFDDVESIFMRRDGMHTKEWHFSQDSVFFHAVDEMDTSRTTVVLTTNKPHLVDEAIQDRFLQYPLDYPSGELLLAVARRRALDQKYSTDQLADLAQHLREQISAGQLHSIRDAQHATLKHYVSSVIDPT